VTRDVTIREARDEDADDLAVLLTQLGYQTDSAAVPERMSRMRAETGQHILVAELEGKVVATMTVLVRHLITREQPYGRLTSVVVLEGHRSAGIGRRMIEEAERMCRAAGCAAIEVTSAGYRDRAHEFYRRLGYEEKPQRFVKLL
jgi:GNAT superfamily N-acetyltransferase